MEKEASSWGLQVAKDLEGVVIPFSEILVRILASVPKMETGRGRTEQVVHRNR